MVHQGRRAGLPKAMFNLGTLLDQGKGVAAPDYPAAADWCRRAADGGGKEAAFNLSNMYAVGRGGAWQVLPRHPHCRPPFFRQMAPHDVASNICRALRHGVSRSKRRATQWMRKAAENGHTNACVRLAARMYGDLPYAREIGHVGEAAGVVEGHDVPPFVLAGVLHWLRLGGHNPVDKLDGFRKVKLEGAAYCCNDGCEVVGHLKEFKVCPQCKTYRYCGNACHKQDRTTGGHKGQCGTFAFK